MYNLVVCFILQQTVGQCPAYQVVYSVKSFVRPLDGEAPAMTWPGGGVVGGGGVLCCPKAMTTSAISDNNNVNN